MNIARTMGMCDPKSNNKHEHGGFWWANTSCSEYGRQLLALNMAGNYTFLLRAWWTTTTCFKHGGQLLLAVNMVGNYFLL